MFRLKTKRICLFVLSSLVVGAGAASLASRQHNAPVLTQKAHISLVRKAGFNDPEWVSNTEILDEDSTGEYFVYNVQTKRETSLHPLPTQEVVRWLDKYTRMVHLEDRRNWFQPDRQPKSLPALPFPVGDDFYVTECVTSPLKDKRLWRIEFNEAPLAARWSHRIYSAYKPSGNPTVGLCISDMDGSNARLLGVERSAPGRLRLLEPPNINEEVKYSLIHDIHWTPNGKNISFIHKDTLFVLPID